jgi:hypothetical protein
LTHRALPRSIGLTFTVKAQNGDPQAEICVTWARYFRKSNGDFHRKPAFFLSGAISVAQDSQSFLPRK